MSSNMFKILVGIVVVVLAFYMFLDSPPKCDETQSVKMSIIVDEAMQQVIGFNTDTDHLNFGKVSGGSLVSRNIIANYPSGTGQIFLTGKMAEWVSVTENNFAITGNKTIGFKASVPEFTAEGNYSGNAVFCFKT